MKHQVKEGEFRSNLHSGGKAKFIEFSDEEENRAIKAANLLGLGIAGVDLLQSNKGPLVMELNSSPGMEGIEGTTKRDNVTKIINYIEINK
jgi:ribosomal protein S6--L-glutamate ligase